MIIKGADKLLGICAWFLLFFACSSGPAVQEFPESANGGDELQSFAKDVSDAGERQVNVLSPTYFDGAKRELDAAQKAHSSGKDNKDVLHRVAVGRSQLRRANEVAESTRSYIEGVIAARQAAIAANAPTITEEQFRRADETFRRVTVSAEDNDMSSVKSRRDELQKLYMDVELAAIKKSNLDNVESVIERAKKDGAKSDAKQSLALAEKEYNDAETYIIANRHDAPGIKERVERASAAADHLLKITHLAKSGKNISPEEMALKLEQEKKAAETAREKVASEKMTNSELERQTEHLKSEQKFNKTFETARAEFSENEAEVYRQGDQLIIRLKALNFPVNQAVLRGDNFPLLSKVAKVVGEFDNAVVVVEGHTDAAGSKELNRKLSTERAEAVSNYLVSNAAVEKDKIKVVGAGYERPLASNKTLSGRAQNRRVDVIIKPATSVTE